jgi:hypothetical protein
MATKSMTAYHRSRIVPVEVLAEVSPPTGKSRLSALPLVGLISFVTALFLTGFLMLPQIFAGENNSHGHAGSHAHLGEAVIVPGGLLTVERVTSEVMAPPQTDKFSASGMSMSSMGMDMAPKGFRRFTIDFTLLAQSGNGLRFTPDSFRVSGPGLQEAGPIQFHIGDEFIPKGSAASGSLKFQVPEKAVNLMVSFNNGEKMIGLDTLQPVENTHPH